MIGPTDLSTPSLLWAALTFAVGCSAAPSPYEPPVLQAVTTNEAPQASAPAEPPEPLAKKVDRFAIATENDAALAVAATVLDRGGNAIDAAVAGILVAGVAQPSSTGLGGDGFAVVWDADKKTAFTVDFRATSPKGLRRADHLSRSPKKKKRGVMVGVPGMVAGLFAMHEHGGKLPWADLVGLAADVADQGFVVSPYLAEAFAWLANEKDVDPSFSVGQPMAGPPTDASGARPAPVPSGASLQNPSLATALRAIATGGPKAFYSGELARDVVDTARAGGSSMTQADLALYQAAVREPLAFDWEGFRVLTVAPPSAGGVALAEMLGLFPKADLRALGFGTGPYVHLLAEGLRTTLVDRQLLIGDPAFTKMDVAALLDPARLNAKRASFHLDATTMPKIRGIKEGGTYHLAILDESGNAVSVTTTLTDLFGAKLVTRAGFPLNDALVDFTMDDYGQRPTNRGPNFPRGGARPTSSLTPTIVMRDGAVVLALGASGGLRAPSSVVEVLFARLVFDRPLAEAVSGPRFHVPSSGALYLDSGLAKLSEDLRGRGEIVDANRPDFGAISAVERHDENGRRVFGAAGDPRKHGVALVRSAPPRSPANAIDSPK